MAIQVSQDVKKKIVAMLHSGHTNRTITRKTGVSNFAVNGIRSTGEFSFKKHKWPRIRLPGLEQLSTAEWCIGRTGGHVVAETSRMGIMPHTTVVEKETVHNDTYIRKATDVKSLQQRARLISEAPNLLALVMDVLEMRNIEGVGNNHLVNRLMLRAEDILENVSNNDDSGQ